jgi:hypothetical protein
MTKPPSQRPSARPSYGPPPYEPPSRSIRPSEPRSRAIFAGVCAMVFGAFVVSAFVRSCEGDDFFNTVKKTAPAKPSP